MSLSNRISQPGGANLVDPETTIERRDVTVSKQPPSTPSTGRLWINPVRHHAPVREFDGTRWRRKRQRQDRLEAVDTTPGNVTDHIWRIREPAFGTPGESGDEVDKIELKYQTAAFDNLTEADVTVTMHRTLSDGVERATIGLNSGNYSGSSAVLDLSGYSQTDAAGPITVEVSGMTNPTTLSEEATLRLVGDAGPVERTGYFPEGDPGPQVPTHPIAYHVDVGVGDCSVVRTPADETMLIDSGPDSVHSLAFLDALGVKRIEHVVATHAHHDHIGGMQAIIEEFQDNRDGVGTVYDTGVSTGSQTYADYVAAVDSYGKSLVIPREGEELPVDGARVLCLNPESGTLGETLHDHSVTLKVEQKGGGRSWLVTGDANQYAEDRMVANYPAELGADVYQVGHHGSTTSTAQAFLDAIAPDVAVISTAAGNSFGHPENAVLDKLAAAGVETYYTDAHGDVTTETWPKELIRDSKQTASTDPTTYKTTTN